MFRGPSTLLVIKADLVHPIGLRAPAVKGSVRSGPVGNYELTMPGLLRARKSHYAEISLS